MELPVQQQVVGLLVEVAEVELIVPVLREDRAVEVQQILHIRGLDSQELQIQVVAVEEVLMVLQRLEGDLADQESSSSDT